MAKANTAARARYLWGSDDLVLVHDLDGLSHPKGQSMDDEPVKKYSEDQPRDEHGRFAGGSDWSVGDTKTVAEGRLSCLSRAGRACRTSTLRS